MVRLHLLALCLLSLYYADAAEPIAWPKELSKSPRIVGFSWRNCGPATDPLQINSITVSPDPVRVPGTITATFTSVVTSQLPTDITAKVTMEKKVAGFFIKIPCVENFGSCSYGGICKDWADVCPKYFEKYGFPCACPFPARTYTIPDISFNITSKLAPGTSGNYRAQADLVSSEVHLDCIEAELDVE